MESEAEVYLEDNDGNMLAAMFAKQLDLDEEFSSIEDRVFNTFTGGNLPGRPHAPFHHMLKRPRQMYAANLVLRIIVELVEMLKHFDGWKLWKRAPRDAEPGKAQEEFVDVVHFVLELASYIGFDSKTLYEAYFDKAAINTTRQEENY